MARAGLCRLSINARALSAPFTTLASSGSIPSFTPFGSASAQALAISSSRSRQASGEALSG